MQNTINFYKGNIEPEENTIFVFGSNPEGIHGAGAARVALLKFGAEYGVGEMKPFYLLFPESLETEYEYIIDLTSVNCAPY